MFASIVSSANKVSGRDVPKANNVNKKIEFCPGGTKQQGMLCTR
jgi:hypothetical protein